MNVPRAAAGLSACGVLALALHGGGVASWLSGGDARPLAIFREADGALAWSRDAARDGLALDAHGLPAGPVTGWRGLLLGRPLDLSTATLEDLEALPGVGEKTARRILEARGGPEGVRTLSDLEGLPGMGQKRVARLAPWVRMSRNDPSAAEVSK